MSVLYIIATPIGNLEDMTLRALRILGEVDVLACEDTRITRKIFTSHNVSSPTIIFSYNEHNELTAGKRILKHLGDGQSVALCTDSGSPGISDPGYRIISDALEEDYKVEVIPGPSAVITSIIASGLPTSSFIFKGFPPRKDGARKRFLEMEKDLPHTLVFYESPHRVAKLLVNALEVYGNRMTAVCIELTKKFERVHRDYLKELISSLENTNIRGEVTVVIAGNKPKFKKEEREYLQMGKTD